MNLVLKIHKIFHSILYIRISESFLAQFTSHNHPHRSRTPVIVVTNKETKRQQCQHPPKSVLTNWFQFEWVGASKRVGEVWERKWGKGEKQADSRIKVSVWLRREIVQVVSHLQRKRKGTFRTTKKLSRKSLHTKNTRDKVDAIWEEEEAKVKAKEKNIREICYCRYSSLLTWLASRFPFPHDIYPLISLASGSACCMLV